jgi:hypothetical protein
MSVKVKLSGEVYALPDSQIYINCANNIFEDIYNNFEYFSAGVFMGLMTKQLNEFRDNHRAGLESKNVCNWLYINHYLKRDNKGMFYRSDKLKKEVVLPYGILKQKNNLKIIKKSHCQSK